MSVLLSTSLTYVGCFSTKFVQAVAAKHTWLGLAQVMQSVGQTWGLHGTNAGHLDWSE